MTRFFITMDDAISLVIHAFKNVNNGETFILKAKSATMLDVAKTINKIFKNKKNKYTWSQTWRKNSRNISDKI